MPLSSYLAWPSILYAGSMRKKEKYKRMKPPVTSSRMTDVGDGGSLKKHLTMGKVSPSNGATTGSISELYRIFE